MRKSASALVALAAGLLLCGAAVAQDQSLSGAARDARLLELRQMATRGQPVPMPVQEAELDAALARGDLPALRGLMAVHTADDAHRMLNWSKLTVFEGAPFAVGYFYATDLWTAGEAMERHAARGGANVEALNAQARTFKKTSVLMALHTIIQVQVDAARCTDVMAGAKHIGDMSSALAPQWSYGAGLPLDERKQLVAQAMVMEMEIASVRQPDGWLCASETAQMQPMAPSTATLQAAEDARTPGRDFTVAIQPQDLAVPDEVWWSKVDDTRRIALAMAAALLNVSLSQIAAE